MEKSVLVMIVAPLMGHMAQALEMAKLMLDRNNQISITVLIMKLSIDHENSSRIDSIITASTTTERLHFLRLPEPEDTSQWCSTYKGSYFNQLIEYEKPYVREIVSNIKNLSAFIIDLANTTMMDIADELGVACYIFFTSGAAFLGLVLHLLALENEQNHKISDQLHSCTHLITPCFINPVPVVVLPTVITNKEIWCQRFLQYSRYRKAKAIIVNTFAELEDHALSSFSSESAYGKSRLPPIHAVGPIISRFQTSSSEKISDIMQWLDAQSSSSVVFLCFGSMGSLHLDQIKEIAKGIERSGYRFLWSLRESPVVMARFPREYENFESVMPEGFLNRTVSIGKIVGWVPQLAVLSHSAVGGFVSHCGWNSTLESIWCGVPIATWPLFAEQQLNAFQLVKDLGIAVEISLDYNEAKENQEIITAEQIEEGIKKLMDGENEERKRVKELSEQSRLAMSEGGSSYLSFQNLIQSICSND